MDKTKQILALAVFLCDNDPEGSTLFETKVSYFVDYAQGLIHAGLPVNMTPEFVAIAQEAYPHLAKLTLDQLLAYS